MKKFISRIVIAFLFACEGPEGPRGIPGQDGGLIVAGAFEIAIDFTADNNYQYIEPYGFELYPYDMTLVYILWETDNGTDIWRLLPQSTTFIDDTFLIYNYDFTQDDVRFFLDGTTDFSTLDASWTQNQIFRVVVVPADNVDGLDYSNLNAVMQTFDITDFEQL